MSRSTKNTLGNALIWIGGANLLVTVLVTYLWMWELWPETLDAFSIGTGHFFIGMGFALIGSGVKI